MKKNLLNLSLVLVIIGAINWGLVGLFGLDLVATLFGFSHPIARMVYVMVGAAGAYLAYLAKDIVVSSL
jgi:uncharacterized membrane protein YuzA (DUF378 family)